MIDADGWVDWAIKRPGPAAKVNPGQNLLKGQACHSVEGWLAGAFGELDNHDRQASWHFTNDLDGNLYQHYSIFARVWASGNSKANGELVATESTGIAGTPLNWAQVANMLRLSVDLIPFMGAPTRVLPGRNVWQHNEVWNWTTPNAGPTACPSNRYDGFFARLEEEDDEVKQSDFDDLVLAVFAGSEERDLTGATLPRESRLEVARWRMKERAEGRAQSVLQIAAATPLLTVPAHKHEMTIAISSTGGVIKP